MSEETTATCSAARWSAASRSIAASASGAQRTSSEPCCSSSPCPSKTSTPRAPFAATQLASRSRSASGEPKPPACSRLKPSNRYRVGSAIALPSRLVQQHGRGHAHVQRLDAAELWDRDREVAGPPHQRPQASPLRAEDEGEPTGEVGLPHRRAGVAGGRRDPDVVALDLAEVAGAARHHRDRPALA